jgi:HEAT repeat protein
LLFSGKRVSIISARSEVTPMDLIARLIEQLASDDEVVRVQAGELLLQMGSAAVRRSLTPFKIPVNLPAR